MIELHGETVVRDAAHRLIAFGVVLFPRQIHDLFMMSGTEGMDKMFGTKKMVDDLNALGIKAEYYESTGTDHEWLTWRRGLKKFIPHLFK